MELDPKLVGPQVELGLIAGQSREWAESANYLDRALQLDPDSYPSAWFALGVARYNLKGFDAAETAMREALQRDRQHSNPKIEYVLGLILADKGNYAGAASALQDYLRLAPNAPDAARVKEILSQFPNTGGPSSGPVK
jgi:tetratricopeptide (TPR) repeat protein